MLRRNIKKIMMLGALLATTTSAFAGQCMEIGGTAMGNSVSETRIVAALTGSFSGASAEILKQTETKTGLKLDLEHFFVNPKGGMIQTRDEATLTNVVGKEGVYMLEIHYNIVKGTGALEGYKGDFKSYGLIDLNQGKVALRYEGELCK